MLTASGLDALKAQLDSEISISVDINTAIQIISFRKTPGFAGEAVMV